MLSMKRVIVAGAGFGGIGAAVALRRLVSRAQVEIVLVDRRSDFVMGFRKTWAALGIDGLEPGRRDLRTIADVTLTVGDITRLDAGERRIEVDGQSIEGDALVIALGAQQAADAVPGLAEFGLNVWDRDTAATAWSQLSAVRSGAVVIGIFGLPYTCPPAPYELALLCRERLGPQVGLSVFGPAPMALPVVGAVESAKVERLLADHRIGFMPGRQATAVERGRIVFADGTEQAFDVLLAVPPHRCPQLLVDAGLAEPGGWLRPDPHTLELQLPDVYAVGDCTAITLANGLPLPKAGIFAHAQGEVVAARIAAGLAGRPPTATFAGDGYCFIETGGGRAAKAAGRFLADPVQVEISEPTAAGMIEKREFERARLAEWFGQ
jgi:sulfide:quinone oxidoreductase